MAHQNNQPGPAASGARVYHLNGYTVLQLAGDIGLAAREELRNALADARSTPPHHLVLDFTALSYLDAFGLRAVAAPSRAARASRLRLRAVAPQEPRITQILSLTGLTEELDVYATVADATDGGQPPAAVLPRR